MAKTTLALEESMAPPGRDSKPHLGRRMSEQEFVAWLDDTTHAEWVDGEVVMMSPISSDHDEYQFWLRMLLHTYAKRRQMGRVKGPEFMVRLDQQRAWREPDILFVSTSRLHLIKRNQMEGPPDLVMEIVSPESRNRDWEEKFNEYARAGVREYWIVDRENDRVEAFAQGAQGEYRRIVPRDGRIDSTVLTGFYLGVDWLLAEQPPDEAEVLQEILAS